MLIRSHTTMAFMVGAYTSLKVFGGFVPAFLLGCLVGGALPDLDHPKSKVGRLFLLLSLPLYLLVGHRGMTHSWVPLVFLFFVCVGLSYTEHLFLLLFFLGVFLGYVIHLLGDFFTRGGISFFWPSRKRVGVALIRTGGMGEGLLMFFFVGLMSVLLFNEVVYLWAGNNGVKLIWDLKNTIQLSWL